MPKSLAPTLSEHLLEEAAKFILYPQRAYRTKTNLQTQALLEAGVKRLVEWRKTLAPSKDRIAAKVLENGRMLDELYARELLRSVPDIVHRTQSLAEVAVPRGSVEGFVYLREASNCYVLGLAQATVALARAAVEVPLRTVAAKQFGARAVTAVGLFELLELAKRARLLSKLAMDAGHKVRQAADKVLHEDATTPADALEVLEAARIVVAEIAMKTG